MILMSAERWACVVLILIASDVAGQSIPIGGPTGGDAIRLSPAVDCDPGSCLDAILLGQVSGDTDADLVSHTASGSRWLRLAVRENNSSLIDCIPLSVTIRLVPPPGTDYDLQVYWGDCSTLATRSTQRGSATEVLRLWWDEACSSGFPTGFDDSRTLNLEVLCSSVPINDNWMLEIEGNSEPVSAVGNVPAAQSAVLRHNEPNPFNPRTTIKFDLPTAGPVRLSVFDVAGRLVRTLVDDSLPQGSHEAVWDGRDASGRGVGSGSYLARLEFGGKVETVRMVMIS